MQFFFNNPSGLPEFTVPLYNLIGDRSTSKYQFSPLKSYVSREPQRQRGEDYVYWCIHVNTYRHAPCTDMHNCIEAIPSFVVANTVPESSISRQTVLEH